jgi:hypothetical protein
MPIGPEEMIHAPSRALHAFDASDEKPMGLLAQAALIAALLELIGLLGGRRSRGGLARIAGGDWPDKKLGGFNVQNLGETVDDVDAGGIDAALKRADVGAVDVCPMRDLLLGQAANLAQTPQVERQHLSDVHARESNSLQSI